jgi:DNA-nicking Smr family endonuclease
MSKRDRPDLPRASRLSPEEEALWQHVTKDVKAARGKRHVETAPDDNERTIEQRLNAGRTQPPASGRPNRSSSSPRQAPLPATLSRRGARKIASGRVEIDARIDLHGMRQSEAHAALRRFLMSCRADGCRTVLVITGKGGALRDATPDAVPCERTDRGILKRNVPRWLVEPDLAAIVVSFTTAHARHGGDGALYVTLRRK